MRNFKEITQRFSAQADEFVQWITGTTQENTDTTQSILKCVSNLYALALELPPPGEFDAADSDLIQTVTAEEWTMVSKKCAKLVGFDYYAMVFDPSIFPPEESIQGSVLDDLADIYRDIEDGRRYYNAGLFEKALWQWSFCFRFHWGQHATNAMNALHHHAISQFE